MKPEFAWYFDKARARYVITRGGQTYQEIVPNRQNPAHGLRYVERCVRILNGEM